MHDETYNRMLYGTFLPSTRPKHRVDSMAAMHGMVRAGLGVSILPCYTADLDSDLVRLDEKPFLDPKFSIEEWAKSKPFSNPRMLEEFKSDLFSAGLP